MANLLFVEPEKGTWFYVQERSGAPNDSWDWREYADAFGPFDTYEAACDHQYDFQATTSGSEVRKHTDLGGVLDENLLKLIADAPSNTASAPRARF